MVAVSSLNFSVYEQYTSDTAQDGSTSQSGALQAGVTVGTDDGSSYGSSIILDVSKSPATKKLSSGLKAVNTLTQVANYARTQAPKDAAAGRLAEAIGQLRTLDLFGGGIRAVEQAVRIAQEIAGAVRDLAAAEEAIAAQGGGGGSSDSAAGASAGAAASAALSAALSGSATPPTPSVPAPSAAAAAPSDAAIAPTAPATNEQAGYAGQAGAGITALVADVAGLGSGSDGNQKASSTVADALLGELQAAGLPVDSSSLEKSLEDLVTNPILGAQELQSSAQQAGLNVTVTTSLAVSSTLTDPRSAAASGTSAAAAAASINDPYDGLIHDAVTALSDIGKGLRRALPPLLNSPDKKIAHRAKKAQDDFAQAVADTVKSIGDYYTAKAEVEAEGITEGPPSPLAKAAIDAANATINGTSDTDDTDDSADAPDADAGDADADVGTAAVGADGTPAIAAGSIAGTSIAVHVSVNIQV